MRWRMALCLALTTALIAGCGTAAPPSPTVEPTPTPSTEPTPSPTPDPTPEPTPDLTAYNTCVELLGPLLDALGELDSRLDVGLNIGEYGDLVADANVIYDRVEFDQFGADGLTCLSEVGLPLEEALNKYFQAHQIWDDCIEDAACSTDSITTRLQRLWAQAETSISDARDSMSDLRGP